MLNQIIFGLPLSPALGSRRKTHAMKLWAIMLSTPMMVITGMPATRWFTADVSKTSGSR